MIAVQLTAVSHLRIGDRFVGSYGDWTVKRISHLSGNRIEAYFYEGGSHIFGALAEVALISEDNNVIKDFHRKIMERPNNMIDAAETLCKGDLFCWDDRRGFWYEVEFIESPDDKTLTIIVSNDAEPFLHVPLSTRVYIARRNAPKVYDDPAVIRDFWHKVTDVKKGTIGDLEAGCIALIEWQMGPIYVAKIEVHDEALGTVLITDESGETNRHWTGRGGIFYTPPQYD